AAQDCTLPAGEYQLQVSERDRDEGGGQYQVNLQRLSAATACESIQLGCDVTLQGDFASSLDDDLYVFNVTGTEIVRIAASDVGGAGSEPAWRLLDATGAPAAV